MPAFAVGERILRTEWGHAGVVKEILSGNSVCIRVDKRHLHRGQSATFVCDAVELLKFPNRK